MNINPNAPAYPQSAVVDTNRSNTVVEALNAHVSEVEGMSIRTYIATKAMAAIITAEYGVNICRISQPFAASQAVQFADALIAELNKTQP